MSPIDELILPSHEDAYGANPGRAASPDFALLTDSISRFFHELD